MRFLLHSIFFFFNDTATTEIYTLSLHDALPIYPGVAEIVDPDFVQEDPLGDPVRGGRGRCRHVRGRQGGLPARRSEEHTSELQSQSNLVCRLLLEKKKKINHQSHDQLIVIDSLL